VAPLPATRTAATSPAVAAPDDIERAAVRAALAAGNAASSLETADIDAAFGTAPVAPSRGGKAEAAARRQILQKPARSTP
jgi:hypothetical protein